ncbi:hypothetical protein [Blastomonas sp. SL216]|uniref:hypothetical protein n=1 Tax=Blastomonas sp. SL216 TaxID=2995169 RepID=UPI002377A9D3|nr:hypothetical protein OU999_02390 [Blastomonas sp. SL216]
MALYTGITTDNDGASAVAWLSLEPALLMHFFYLQRSRHRRSDHQQTQNVFVQSQLEANGRKASPKPAHANLIALKRLFAQSYPNSNLFRHLFDKRDGDGKIETARLNGLSRGEDRPT